MRNRTSRQIISPALAILLLGMAFILAPTASGQINTATLSGTVVDQSGAVVPSVKIVLTNINTNSRRQISTNKEGIFVIPQLEPGKYKLQATREGFSLFQVADITLNTNDRRDLQIKMQIGKATESITVDAKLISVDTSSAVSTVVDEDFVKNMPLNGRTFQNLLLMTPGVIMADGAGQLSFDGERTNANGWYIDGVSANFGVPKVRYGVGPGGDIDQNASGATPGFNVLGGTNSLISADAMQEFQVQASGYNASRGRQSGGQISITSKSGTNKYHGSLFDYFRNDKLDANSWFNNNKVPMVKKSALRQNDFGATFGGPIVPNRTFFFFTYEGLRQMLPTNVTSREVPSRAIRTLSTLTSEMRAVLNSFPAPTGPDKVNAAGNPTGAADFVVSQSNGQDMDTYSIKIDHTFNSKLTAFGRFNRGDTSSEQWAVNQLTKSKVPTRTLTLGTTAQLTPHLTNDLRFNWSKNQYDRTWQMTDRYGATPLTRAQVESHYPRPFPSDTVFSYSLGLSMGVGYTDGPVYGNRQQQYNLVDTLTWTRGKHNFQFGIDARWMYPKYGFRQDMVLLSTSMSYILLHPDKPISSASVSVSDPITMLIKNYSMFAQDSWKIKPRLTLDLGLRWEYNLPPEGKNKPLYTLTGFPDLTQLKLSDPNTPMYRTPRAEFAPRVGFSYQLQRTPSWDTILRGSYGLFYDLGVGTAALAATQFPFNRSFGAIGAPFPYPLMPAQVGDPTPLNLNPPYTGQNFTVFDQDYVLPRTHQWNVAIQQTLGKDQTLSLTYVGKAGRRLLRRYWYQFPYTNPVNTNFTGANLSITRNSPNYSDTSDYNAFQMALMRRMSHRLQAMVNYTWSHAIDTGSDDYNFDTTGKAPTVRGNSYLDRRHNFNAAVTYELPSIKTQNQGLNWIGKTLANGWATDYIFKAQSGRPQDVTGGVAGFDGISSYGRSIRLDVVPGQPIWITDNNAPGHKILNRAAFAFPASAYGPDNGITNGNMGRGSLTSMGMYQLDFVIRRDFKIAEGKTLQFRSEFFNVMNHPNFGFMTTNYGNLNVSGTTKTLTPDANFGKITTLLGGAYTAYGSGLTSLYNMGGNRSIQMALKLTF